MCFYFFMKMYSEEIGKLFKEMGLLCQLKKNIPMETNFRTLQDFFKSIGLPMTQDFEMTIHPLKG